MVGLGQYARARSKLIECTLCIMHFLDKLQLVIRFSRFVNVLNICL